MKGVRNLCMMALACDLNIKDNTREGRGNILPWCIKIRDNAHTNNSLKELFAVTRTLAKI